jgi:hypothetical protein
LWLFSACCLRRWTTAADTENLNELIDLTEQVADGIIDRRRLWNARTRFPGVDRLLWMAFASTAMQAAQDGSLECATEVANNDPLYHSLDASQDERRKWWEDGFWRERDAQAELLRDLFGPTIARHIDVPASWLGWNDGCIVRIGQAIYDERAFDRMPILADALEDAGCDNADILNHCREPGEHVRGCWVVDLLLGKS